MELVAIECFLCQENNPEDKTTPLPVGNYPELETGLWKLSVWVWLGKRCFLGNILGTPELLSHRIPSPVMSGTVFDSTRQKDEARQAVHRQRVPLEVDNTLASGR